MKRIGIVSYWFNRGQATVGRTIRYGMERAGHSVFVLARRASKTFASPEIATAPDFQPEARVQIATTHMIPLSELRSWVLENNLEVVFFYQNYQFSEITELRRLGIKTIGGFVWESFSHEHVSSALEAFDVIFSLTRAEQERYWSMGIDSPYVGWGVFPDDLRLGIERDIGGRNPDFLFSAGYLSNRKPTGTIVKAFSLSGLKGSKLTLKAQRHFLPSDFVVPNSLQEVREARKSGLGFGLVESDFCGVELVAEDLPRDDFGKLLARHDVSICASRWEGLGLNLYESLAYGIPIIANDIEPINEIVVDGVNGILVPSSLIGFRPNGVPAYEPELDSLVEAFQEISRRSSYKTLAQGARSTAKDADIAYTWASLEGLL